ncbi:MAG TPA: RtcB family protein [candidate division WOR-3 bacterium]|uniref:3'-phosphate/5'-hydroxy nucleic acid ligase n=1 Tax=candidate division WOR-3 bacterium TaxID=2052148 RepID=A0A7C5HG90_UNCW3|nr:RtcB family protein [candidate division WOR-3 bacterium]
MPIKSWCKNPEEGALEQAVNLSSLPFVFKHVALMPDTHQGYGMPIGGVVATKGVIIPNAVGVDIGCGMSAVKTSLKIEHLKRDTLIQIIGNIKKVVPVGFEHHVEDQDEKLLPISYLPYKDTIVSKEYQNALKQLGTLGGGNHFIEIQKDEKGYIWIMIHSGSRNLGFKVAKHYNDIAEKLNKKWYSSVKPELELAFLPVDTYEGKNYLKEMKYCVDFAFANRKLMMQRICNFFSIYFEGASFNSIINIAHNYARLENHYGQNVFVHRKGATCARSGELGIIPGSQGTASYIVRGKGNPESFQSCSHGAGRVMGRNQAKRTLNLKEEIKLMDDKDIIHEIKTVNDLDEAPGSYKDIDIVMEEQEDLVDIVEKLTPLAVIKG